MRKTIDGLGGEFVGTGRWEVWKGQNGNPDTEEQLGTFNTEDEANTFFEQAVGEQAIRFSKQRGFGCEVQVVEENSVVVCDGTFEGDYVSFWMQEEEDYSARIQ